MKNIKISKTLSILLACIILITSGTVVAFANTEFTLTSNIRGNIGEKVAINNDEQILVSVPKKVVLSGQYEGKDKKYKGSYTVGVDGNFAENKVVDVVPNKTFELHQDGKKDKIAKVEQLKTSFIYDDVKNKSNTSNGTVSAEYLTAGSWKGSFNFEVSVTEKEMLYSSIELAVTDANNLNYENADVLEENKDNAVASLKIKGDKAYITLLKDEENVDTLKILKDTNINLNNHTLKFIKRHYPGCIVADNNLTIHDGSLIGYESQYIISTNENVYDEEKTNCFLLSVDNCNLTNYLVDNEWNGFSEYLIYSKAMQNNIEKNNLKIEQNAKGHAGSNLIGIGINSIDDSSIINNTIEISVNDPQNADDPQSAAGIVLENGKNCYINNNTININAPIHYNYEGPFGTTGIYIKKLGYYDQITEIKSNNINTFPTIKEFTQFITHDYGIKIDCLNRSGPDNVPYNDIHIENCTVRSINSALEFNGCINVSINGGNYSSFNTVLNSNLSKYSYLDIENASFKNDTELLKYFEENMEDDIPMIMSNNNKTAVLNSNCNIKNSEFINKIVSKAFENNMAIGVLLRVNNDDKEYYNDGNITFENCHIYGVYSGIMNNRYYPDEANETNQTNWNGKITLKGNTKVEGATWYDGDVSLIIDERTN